MNSKANTSDPMVLIVQMTSEPREQLYFCIVRCEKILYDLINCFRLFFRHFASKEFSLSRIHLHFQASELLVSPGILFNWNFHSFIVLLIYFNRSSFILIYSSEYDSLFCFQVITCNAFFEDIQWTWIFYGRWSDVYQLHVWDYPLLIAVKAASKDTVADSESFYGFENWIGESFCWWNQNCCVSSWYVSS